MKHELVISVGAAFGDKSGVNMFNYSTNDDARLVLTRPTV